MNKSKVIKRTRSGCFNKRNFTMLGYNEYSNGRMEDTPEEEYSGACKIISICTMQESFIIRVKLERNK